MLQGLQRQDCVNGCMGRALPTRMWWPCPGSEPGILLGPGLAHTLEEKVTDVLVWVSGNRNLRLPLVIMLQETGNLQGHKFLGSWVYF